jgi:hypothetical protein
MSPEDEVKELKDRVRLLENDKIRLIDFYDIKNKYWPAY